MPQHDQLDISNPRFSHEYLVSVFIRSSSPHVTLVVPLQGPLEIFNAKIELGVQEISPLRKLSNNTTYRLKYVVNLERFTSIIIISIFCFDLLPDRYSKNL